MAKPLARVLALLDILQAGGTRTRRELSDRLGVDERTVRRYVEHLLDLDVPVESVRGRRPRPAQGLFISKGRTELHGRLLDIHHH